MASSPTSSLPESESEWRFHSTGYPSEWIELYRPGRFHPVNLGDTFKDGQYKVIRKLGYGSFSTVWLARDILNTRYVALKVTDAKASLNTEIELSILKQIEKRRSTSVLSQHILRNLDMFHHSGPNGTHLCIVSEPMGPSVASLAEDLLSFEEWKVATDFRYPKQIAKLILKHTLRGLQFLHENGIVHADLQPGNLLPIITDISSVSPDDLHQDLSGQGRNPEPEPVKRLDGLGDKWAPEYLFLGQSLVKYTKVGMDMQVKISDFGAAFWADAPPKSTATPVALRSPELIFGDRINSSIDIWSFGCLAFELLSGVTLFSVMTLFQDQQAQTNDDHLLQMNDLLGPLPDDWLREKWPRAGLYFGPNRERLGPCVGDQEGPLIDEPLEVRFKEHKADEIDDDEASVITSMIRSILKYEPSERPTAREVLQHPWFQQD